MIFDQQNRLLPATRRFAGCCGGVIRILSFQRRKVNIKRGSPSLTAGYLNLSTVLLDIAVDLGQSPTRTTPRVFGGEERLKQMRQVFSVNTYSCITYRQLHPLAGVHRRQRRAFTGVQGKSRKSDM